VSNKKSEIIVVDDHPLIREWLSRLINEQPDLSVCGEAETAQQALQLVSRHAPAIAVVDLSLKETSGLELIKTLKDRHPNVATVVLSMHDEKKYAERAIRAGARGYVSKRETTKRIVDAIRVVLAGRLAVSGTVAALFAECFAGNKPVSHSPVEELTNRELEIFRLIGEGFDNRAIACELRISIKTVQSYCERIKEKLELPNGIELMRQAIRWIDSIGRGA
jgi:DNA-binding NarL/FixJ family response regulator